MNKNLLKSKTGSDQIRWSVIFYEDILSLIEYKQLILPEKSLKPETYIATKSIWIVMRVS